MNSTSSEMVRIEIFSKLAIEPNNYLNFEFSVNARSF